MNPAVGTLRLLQVTVQIPPSILVSSRPETVVSGLHCRESLSLVVVCLFSFPLFLKQTLTGLEWLCRPG